MTGEFEPGDEDRLYNATNFDLETHQEIIETYELL